MKILVTAFSLICASSLISAAEPKPSPTPSKKEFERKAKEVTEMESQLAVAIEKKDTAFLEKVLAESYYDVYEGDKRAASKLITIARSKAGILRNLAIQKERQIKPDKDFIAVEGEAKSRPAKVDDTTPEEEWVHVRRLWIKKDGNWLLTCQIKRREGDDGKGEED
jgi:hypothetical protein